MMKKHFGSVCNYFGAWRGSRASPLHGSTTNFIENILQWSLISLVQEESRKVRRSLVASVSGGAHRSQEAPGEVTGRACDTLWWTGMACDSQSRPVTACKGLWQPVTTCDSLWRPVMVCDRLLQPVTACIGLWRPVKDCDWAYFKLPRT